MATVLSGKLRLDRHGLLNGMYLINAAVAGQTHLTPASPVRLANPQLLVICSTV
jgi:hypothetical protein